MTAAKTAGLARLVTEQQNRESARIDQADSELILRIINREDAGVAAAVEREIPAIARAVDAIVERLRAGGRLFYIGAGTSGRLGVLDASECPPTFNTPPSLVQGIMAGGVRALHRATEASEDVPALGQRDLEKKRLRAGDAVVGLTASGRTPYVIGALRYARRIGAATVAVTCNPDAEIARVAEVTIAPVVGPEVIAGSTRMKAGTAQKLVLNMISTATMVRLGHVYGNFMVNVHLKNAKLVERARTILQRILGIDRAAATQALRRAGNNLKMAIIMERLRLRRGEAEDLLRRHGDNLAAALKE
jgi:N-acetylmuramic acid 6-phosphate etherase